MHRSFLFAPLASILIVIGAYFLLPKILPATYRSDHLQNVATAVTAGEIGDRETEKGEEVAPPFVATHLKTPEAVKALYLTSWVSGVPKLRNHVISMIEKTEANAVVIDIKDYTGKISYVVSDPELAKIGSVENRIPDLRELIADLHTKNIYVIGRVAVFQDPYLITKYPEEAVKKSSDKNSNWKDRKGISWIDAGSLHAWEYAVAIGKDAYSQGFDEINYDYVRFPSDGNMQDIYYPISDGKPKHEVLRSFFEHLRTSFEGSPIITSLDLFGMTATVTDDMGIGQVLEDALPNVDFVDPMVYPSHFPPTWNGFKNPADHPYETIKITMDSAVARAKAMNIDPLKIRPWLQDFDLGATYTKEMVQAQIKATYDAGLTSWLMWDPANTYTPTAFLPAE